MAKRVLIIGGGPAGSSAGIHLQQNNYQVTLLERGGENRSKTCGEGLTPECQNILSKLGVLAQVTKFAYSTDELKVFDLFNKPISIYNQYYTLKRNIFDKLLRDEITRLGGRVFYGTTITDIEVTKEKVIVKDQESNLYEGDVLILATGAETMLAKNLGFNSLGTYNAVSMRAYAKNTIGCSSLEFYFHEKLFPAYGWVFPLPDNILNIGVYTHKESGQIPYMNKLMNIFSEILVEKYHVPLSITDQPKGWIINTGLVTTDLCRDRALICGENISCTYNFSGEGIGPALKSGYLAAQSIIYAKGDYSRTTLLTYESKIRDELAPTHRGYNKLSRLFKHRTILLIALLILRYSKKARELTQSIIDEKIPLEEGLKIKYISHYMFNK